MLLICRAATVRGCVGRQAALREQEAAHGAALDGAAAALRSLQGEHHRQAAEKEAAASDAAQRAAAASAAAQQALLDRVAALEQEQRDRCWTCSAAHFDRFL